MPVTQHDYPLLGAFTALITPFAAPDGESVDYDRLAEQIAVQADGGMTGVVPCGTTGESPTLSEAEQRAVIERTVDVARARGLTVIAGAGSNDTAHAVHMHRCTHSVGADAALHVTPYYNKPSQEGLYRHFMTIADSCGLPIVLYNIPGRTSVALTLDTIVRLAEHPNIQAIKEATGNVGFAAEIASSTELIVLSGDDPLTLPIGAVGGSGVISVLSNIMPQRVSALCTAMQQDDWKTARAINEEILPLARALLTLDTNPVPVKTAMARLGRDSGVLRLPMTEPNDGVIQRIDALLEQYRHLLDMPAAVTA